MKADTERFGFETREALYRVIDARRDVRMGFLPDPVPDEVLRRVLEAAHRAPSVGFMQPWDFVLIKSEETRRRIKAGFVAAAELEQATFDEERAQQYRALKLEGIEEAPLGIVVTCDPERTGRTGLGRVLNPDMELFSCVCAIQNLWLAARAENLGVGWVSILDYSLLKTLLGVPDSHKVVAYLCVGYVEQFERVPDLERAGWQRRLSLSDLVHSEYW